MQDKLKVNSSAGRGAFSTQRIIDRYKSVNRTQGCIFVHTDVIILLHRWIKQHVMMTMPRS